VNRYFNLFFTNSETFLRKRMQRYTFLYKMKIFFWSFLHLK